MSMEDSLTVEESNVSNQMEEVTPTTMRQPLDPTELLNLEKGGYVAKESSNYQPKYAFDYQSNIPDLPTRNLTEVNGYVGSQKKEYNPLINPYTYGLNPHTYGLNRDYSNKNYIIPPYKKKDDDKPIMTYDKFPDNFNREQTIIELNRKQSEFIINSRKEIYKRYLEYIEQGSSLMELPIHSLLWSINKRKLVAEVLDIFKKITVVYSSSKISIKKPIIDMEELDEDVDITRIILEFPTS